MQLIVGGMGQGKLSYVLGQLGEVPVTDGAMCSMEEAFSAKVLYRFHMLIRRLLQERCSLEVFLTTLCERNPAVTIICDEVGCGIVPIDAFEREYREVVGRSCCTLASQAETVVRVICGIGEKIKG